MSTPPIGLVSDASQARAALTPIRRQLLARLRAPGSAASLAVELGVARQKLGYHLRALEAAGLVRLVEERPRRGFTERVLVASADAFVLDPSLMGEPAPRGAEAQDRFASEHLVHTAAAAMRDVARMREAADREGKRLLTFTIEAEVTFASPADFDQFAERLSRAVARLARSFKSARGGRRYRLVAAAHPAVDTRRSTS